MLTKMGVPAITTNDKIEFITEKDSSGVFIYKLSFNNKDSFIGANSLAVCLNIFCTKKEKEKF